MIHTNKISNVRNKWAKGVSIVRNCLSLSNTLQSCWARYYVITVYSIKQKQQ